MYSKDYKLNSKKMNDLACETFCIIILLMFPIMAGITSLSKEIILLIAGDSFVSAIFSVDVLAIAAAFCIFGYFFGNAILIIFNREKFVLKTTIYAAIINIVLNFVLIPNFKQDAAAITTLISQAVSCFILAKEGLKYVDLRTTYKTFLHSITGTSFILLIIQILRLFNMNLYIFIMLSIILSIIVYLIILVKLKNRVVLNILREINSKIKSKNI